jgi:hypothetical protein
VFDFVDKETLLDSPYAIQPYGGFISCSTHYLPEAFEHLKWKMITLSETKKLKSYEFHFT